MSSILGEDFLILSGAEALAAMPGAAGGRFATLAVLNAKGTLELLYRPLLPGGATPVRSVSVSDATPNDADVATLDFVMPAPYASGGPVRVEVRRGPVGKGNGARVHEIRPAASPELFGQFVLRFFDGINHQRATWRRFPST